MREAVGRDGGRGGRGRIWGGGGKGERRGEEYEYKEYPGPRHKGNRWRVILLGMFSQG
jgi:hypothetical protein